MNIEQNITLELIIIITVICIVGINLKILATVRVFIIFKRGPRGSFNVFSHIIGITPWQFISYEVAMLILFDEIFIHYDGFDSGVYT